MALSEEFRRNLHVRAPFAGPYSVTIQVTIGAEERIKGESVAACSSVIPTGPPPSTRVLRPFRRKHNGGKKKK